MTKDAYFDLCFQLESEPIDEEIPVELSDLPDAAQEAWTIYCYLADRYDSFSGHYFGKSLENIASLFELFGVDDKVTCLKLVTLFDRSETEQINRLKQTIAFFISTAQTGESKVSCSLGLDSNKICNMVNTIFESS